MASSEEVMMKDKGKGDEEMNGLKDVSREDVFVVTKKRALIMVVIVVVLVILIGILIGVLSANAAAEKARKEAASGAETKPTQKPPSDSTSTPMPTPTGKPPCIPDGPWCNIRLPTNVWPIHYDLFLHPNLTQGSYTGKVQIVTWVNSSTKYVLIHIRSMNITKHAIYKQKEGAAVDSIDRGAQVAVRETKEFKGNEFFVFNMEQELEPGKYVVVLEFEAVLSTELNGFYKSKYFNKEGKERRLATTDFQPSDARKAFPCFDEPAMKATFTTTLVHRPDYIGLSNMPVKEETTLPNGLVKTLFQKTVPMSSYLVTFIVCDFNHTSGFTGTHNNITLRIFSTPAQVEQTKYALNISSRITTYFEKYYKIAYPLPKLDKIAIPDFSSGAMENWGLVSYRETALLFEPGVSSESNKQRVATVVSHELAHMWFGNIVSPKWWNDLWLSEGFASFVEYLGVDYVHPDWNMMDYFLLGDVQRVLPMDSLVTSHPISVEVDDPAKIRQLFDRITYSKGSSIVRMLEGYMGSSLFQRGLQHYLEKYKFKNAKQEDLWLALEEIATNKPIKALMDTWTLQMGYPLITIKRIGSTDKASVTQKHFLLDPKAVVTTKSPFNYTWYVPLTFFTSTRNVTETLMTNPTDEIEWPKSDKWIKGNYKSIGFYRVHYEDSNWVELMEQLKDNYTVFSVSDRTNIIDDAFNLARADYLKYNITLEVFNYIAKETHYVPWRSFLNNLGYLRTVLSNRASYGNFQKILANTVEKAAQGLGWESKPDDKHLDKFLRGSILSTACRAGLPSAVDTAKQMFANYLNNPQNNTIEPGLRNLVYQTGIANTGSEEWERLWKIYENTTEASEKGRIRYGLAGSTQPWILTRYLDYCLDSSKIRSQDATSVIGYVAGNPTGRYLAWNFFRANWDKLFELYGTSTFRLTSLVNSVTYAFNNQFDLDELRSFFESHDAGSGDGAVKQAMEKIQADMDWLRRNEETIEGWMADKIRAMLLSN